jgi:hypothetical protein
MAAEPRLTGRQTADARNIDFAVDRTSVVLENVDRAK